MRLFSVLTVAITLPALYMRWYHIQLDPRLDSILFDQTIVEEGIGANPLMESGRGWDGTSDPYPVKQVLGEATRNTIASSMSEFAFPQIFHHQVNKSHDSLRIPRSP